MTDSLAGYRCRWGESNGSGCDLVADLSPWRTPYDTGNESITFLISEILYKIYDSYVTASIPSDSWPFGDHDGQDDDAEVVDLLIFVFMSQDHVWSSGGTIGIAVDAIEVENDLLFPNAERFFSNITHVGEGDRSSNYQGTQQMQNASDYFPTSVFDIERCTMVILHEFSHTFKLPDGPPKLSNLNGALDTSRYYFGNLNITSQKFMPGHGVPVLGLFNLQKIGWVETIDFTGQNLFDVKLYDLRDDNRDDASGSSLYPGKIYKFQMGGQGLGQQYFLFGYHSGRGADASIWPTASEPVLESTGLEVQHLFMNAENPYVVDIESAFGLFWNISCDTMPDIQLPPFPSGDISGWGSLAPQGSVGYDNYDLWWVNNNSNTLRELVQNGTWGDYTKYTGDVFDFFTSDTLEVNGETWTSPEFSFRTSPDCFWYSDGNYSGQYARHNPQDIPNSLLVRIKEQNDNPADGGPPYMIVDFLSAPDGEVVQPAAANPGEYVVYTPGDDPLHIQWTTEYDDAIDRVDILFSKNGGISFPFVIAEDVPVTSSTTDYFWTPDSTYASTGGRVKVIFKNRFTEYTNEGINPDNIFIVGDFPVCEDLLFPENGEVFVVGDTCTVEWANFHSNVDSVTIHFSLDDGENWGVLAENLNPGIDYLVSPSGTSNLFDIVLTDVMVSGDSRFKLEGFHGSNAASAENVGAGSFAILPKSSVVYSDVTAESEVEFDGDVYNFCSLDVPVEGVVDEMSDLFISFESSPTVGQLYKNVSAIGLLKFAPLTRSFHNTPTSEKTCGIASGDLDNDGYMDLVITSPTSPSVYRYDSENNKYRNLLSDPDYFSPNAAAAFDSSYTTVLVDYDHDGDLDIYLGRAESNGTNLLPAKNALFQQQPDSSFVDVADSLGLADSQESGATLSSVWCDFDNDGWWEVVVGDAGSGPCILYDQNSEGFTVRANPFPSEFPDGNVVSMQWVDIDRDDDFDLLVVRSIGDSWILLNNSGLFSSAVEFPVSQAYSISNAVAVDFDFDGWVDVVQAGANTFNKNQTRLMRNFGGIPGFTSNDLFDQTKATGLETTDRSANGLLFDDFNNDGGLDLFVGANTTNAGNIVFEANPAGQETEFSSNWIGVDLLAAADNKSSLGAVVTVRTANGEILGKQMVDGGSARGGQQPRKLLFGLGSINETIEVEAWWPAHPTLSVTEVVDPTVGGFNQMITIEQGTDIQIHQSSISMIKEIDPQTGLINYSFTWTSNRLTERIENKVHIYDGPGYTNLVTTLYTDIPDVAVPDPQYQRAENGDTLFHHVVEWKNQPCVLGYSFKFVVESCIESTCITGTAAYPIVKTKVCLTQ